MTDHAHELRRYARKIPHPQGETPGVMLRAADEIERLQSVIASQHTTASQETRERIARAICTSCEENPDHRGDAQGNQYRWQDYLPCADAVISAVSEATS